MSLARRSFIAATIAAITFSYSIPAFAGEFGTADEAMAMVAKAAAFYKANGKDKLLAEINAGTKGQFVDRDLYVVPYSIEGIRLAHPYNPKLIGSSVLDAVDFDGKEYGKEEVSLIKTKGSGWVDYKYTDPTTKKLAAKSFYVQKVDDQIFLGAGIYKH